MENVLRATRGSPERPLRVGDREIQCYVLEGGLRVLSGRGMQSALTLGQRHGALLTRFLENRAIEPFISSELAMALSNPIRFVRPGRGGKLAVGYEATVLTEICDVLLDARKNGNLTDKQLQIADQCEMLARAFAKVGIIALVDEATGYQEVRHREALQALLDRYLSEEKAKWAKTFPDEFYKEIFRLRGWDYNPKSVKRPGVVGHLTNDIVYSRIQPGILNKLNEINPTDTRGNRKDKHHQFFTEDYGIPELKQHILNLIFMMRAASDWKEFRRLVDRASPKRGETLQLPLGD